MKDNEAISRQIGKKITHINYFDDIGIVEVFLSDESCIHISGNGNAVNNGEPELNIMIVEPQQPKFTTIK